VLFQQFKIDFVEAVVQIVVDAGFPGSPKLALVTRCPAIRRQVSVGTGSHSKMRLSGLSSSPRDTSSEVSRLGRFDCAGHGRVVD
jgi:hypothetical protein